MSYGYSLWFASGNFETALYVLFLCFCDGLCLGLLICSSVSMVSMLYRPKKQVIHVHSAQDFLKVSLENMKTILILVFTFVLSYSFSSVVAAVTTYSKYLMLQGVSVFTLLEINFPMFGPFVLISNIKSSSSLFLPCFHNNQLSQRKT